MGAKDVFGFVGKVLDDNYRVDEAVGEGGFGVVYRGWHLGFDEPVAIKCLKLPAHFTDEAREVFEQRFRDEGKLLKRLGGRHHAVVKAYDVRILTGQGVPYLVLEWLEGETLDRVMARRLADGTGPFGEAEVVTMLSPVIEALALAHRGDLGQVVAHRDIKPENLFVLRGGGVKILDFGIAKAMAEGEHATQKVSKTSSGFSAFSPSYGAPEQFSSKKHGESGPWTDVHALGLVLSYLVTGRKPYGEGEYADLLLEALSVDRPTPRSKGAQVSDAFEATCARALSQKSAERFSTAGALLTALGGQVAERQVAESIAAPVSHVTSRPAATRLPEMATFQPGVAVAAADDVRHRPAKGVSSFSRPDEVSTQLASARTFEPESRRAVTEDPVPVATSGGGGALIFAVGAVGATLLGLLVLMVSSRESGVETSSVEVAGEKKPSFLDEARKAYADGDYATAVQKLNQLPADSPSWRSPEVQVIYAKWAEWAMKTADASNDAAKKRALLGAVVQSTRVSAELRGKATAQLAAAEATKGGGSVAVVGNQPDAPRQTATAGAPDAPPAGIVAGTQPTAKKEPGAAEKPARGIADPTSSDGEMKMRRVLEGKMTSGKATKDDLKMLKAICQHQGDAACKARAQSEISKL